MNEQYLQLSLVRHAKSDWGNDVSDHDRPLNKRGIKEAPKIAEIAKNKLEKVQLIISSTAKRAYDTAKIFANELNYDNDIILSSKLYHCGINDFLEELAKYGEKHTHIMIFAHNPGISMFANYLDNNFFSNMPTSALANFYIYTNSWETISNNSAINKEYLFPEIFR